MLPPDHSPVQTFDDILNSYPLPPPGPDYYAARRALWLTPRPVLSHPQSPSVSRQRLEGLLSAPNAAADDYVWNHGVKKVWEVLDAGVRLRKPLPLSLIIKIIYAAWLRDNTWPVGAIAPEPDDVLPDNFASPEPLIFPPWTQQLPG